jgi:hypothetical protein
LCKHLNPKTGGLALPCVRTGISSKFNGKLHTVEFQDFPFYRYCITQTNIFRKRKMNSLKTGVKLMACGHKKKSVASFAPILVQMDTSSLTLLFKKKTGVTFLLPL